MPDLRVISSGLEVKGPITSNQVEVASISSTSTLTNKTLTTPTITAAVLSGAVTVASGATITTPTLTFTTSAALTATGATGGSGAVLPTQTPAFVTVTGATGSGVDFPTGPIGATYFIENAFAGTMRFYCVGGTINGTTGTTAALITSTGNKSAWFVNTTATGAWRMVGTT